MSRTMKRLRLTSLLAPLVASAGLAGCLESHPATTTCTVNAAVTCGTILAGDPNNAADVGLVGYSCTGADRPDEFAKYVANIPQGMICAAQGAMADGSNAFCCTPPDRPTACAFNPVAVCTDNNYGFQCRGSDRPEALNPTLTCGNGVRQGDLINYCCSAQPRPVGCTESKGACTGGLLGWQCPTGTRPRGEDFGANESRADYYYFVCAVPTAAANQNNPYSTFCCFTPSPLLPGGSCVTSTMIQNQIPSCVPGRFGFACTGRDTPEDDYSPIHCSEAPVDGISDEGYAAKMYCCDYRKPNGQACQIADECLSGDCTEGFCCALSSCPSCYSCGINGVQGTCRLVPAGGADPTGTCAACNGNGGCQ